MSQDKTLMEIREALVAPFKYEDYEWRINSIFDNKAKGPSATVLCYITSRGAMNRLDEVMGIDGWQDTYEFLPVEGGFNIVCHLSLKLNGEWVTKTDGAPQTHVEAFKGGVSDAFKRACVKWGIGRLLYELENTYVEIKINRPTGIDKARIKYVNDKRTGVKGYWVTPPMPKWAIATEQKITKSPTSGDMNTKGVFPAIREGINLVDNWAYVISTPDHPWNGKALNELDENQLSKVCYSDQKLETFNEKDRCYLESVRDELFTPHQIVREEKKAKKNTKKELKEQADKLMKEKK